MPLHILREEHLMEKCQSCKTPFQDDARWRSEFDCSEHYKVVTCNCNKETWIRVCFEGSGHDDWDGQQSWVNNKRVDVQCSDEIEEDNNVVSGDIVDEPDKILIEKENTSTINNEEKTTIEDEILKNL